jgi:hypothetical protein
MAGKSPPLRHFSLGGKMLTENISPEMLVFLLCVVALMILSLNITLRLRMKNLKKKIDALEKKKRQLT